MTVSTLAALAALSLQDPAGHPDWPLDIALMRPDYAAASSYLEAEEARCEAELPGSEACLTIIYVHLNVAESDREYMAAAELAERWLAQAERRDLLEPREEAFVRFRMAGFLMAAVRTERAIPRVAHRLAVENLSRAIEIYDTLEELPGERGALRAKRAEAVMRLAEEEVYDLDRRTSLWQLADSDLRAAIDLFAQDDEPPSDLVLGNIRADLARTLFERDLPSEAALFAQSAAEYYRAAVRKVDLRLIVADKVRALAVQSLQAGYPKVAIDHYTIILDITIDEGRTDGVIFSVADIMGYAGAFVADGRPGRAVEIYEIALADAGYTALPSNEAFLRGRLLRAMVEDRQFERIPALAAASVAFADEQLAAGQYEAPLLAMKMHARAAWGEALTATGRWAEAEPILKASRAYRVRMAFADPTDTDEINGDLLLAKAISRGSGDFRVARALLLDGMDASLIAARRESGFGDASQATLQAFAPLFREHVRIAFALAEPDGDPR